MQVSGFDKGAANCLTVFKRVFADLDDKFRNLLSRIQVTSP